MFLKPFRVKTQTTLKGSDRKKLRSDVEQQFPSLTSAKTADLIPNKGDVTLVKIVTHSDDNVLVYCVQKNPVFFELFKSLYPTVYTLWKFPDMLPVFTTYREVFPRLVGGADLMLPGVIVKGEPHPKMFGALQKGDLCVIRAPVVLGQTLLSGEDMYASAMKGKGVKTLHILGDQLWEFGDKSQPPVIPDEPDTDSAAEEDDENEIEKTMENQEASASVDEASEGVEQLTVDDATTESKDTASVNTDDDMDGLLQHCFKCAIKSRVKKTDLPLLTSTFLKVHMQPFCPAGHHLDVKKSSYKKFSRFLQQMQSEGFIKLKEVSKGVDAISEVDRTHADLRGLVVPDVPEEENPGDGAAQEEFEPPEISEVLCVTAALLPLLSAQGLHKGDTLTPADLRQHITQYVKTNNLQATENKSLVQLDPILAHLVLTKSEGDQSHLTWNDLFARIVDKMQPGCLIKFPGKPAVLKKGKVDPIKVDVQQRGSKKKVTIVENLEAYGVDPKVFAQTVQRAVACSASAVSSEQKNRGLEVVVQGNQITFIAGLLLDKYKIPRKYVQGLEKGPKSKNRR
ncbi:hypothetical protein BaRGS_00023529 [Batillaria attramentaria]|uniref:Ligatin n=1 Tax=Batillaria attramentaria TaxID=370345 RepID=A0ABD0KDU9_9CAEN